MATKSCTTTLARDIMSDCNEPHAPGVERMFYFIPREAVDFGKSVRDDPHIITDIALIAGKRDYKIRNPLNGTPAIIVTDTNQRSCDLT